MEKKFTMTLLNKETGQLETRDIRTGEIVATNGVLESSFIYSVEIGEAICNLVREGYTYQKISQTQGMPPLHMIYNWRNHHPDFAKKLSEARRDRANYFHDQAVQVIEDSATLDKDEVAREKFRFDGFLKLAERGNPEEYGAKTGNSGSTGPTTIVINTGVNRQEVIEIKGERNEETEGTDGRQSTDHDGGISEGARAIEAEYRGIGAEIDDGESDAGINERELPPAGEEGDEEKSEKENQEESH